MSEGGSTGTRGSADNILHKAHILHKTVADEETRPPLRRAITAPVIRERLSLLALLLILAAAGSWLWPYPPDRPIWGEALLAPGLTHGHWLGTDAIGRDLLARVAAGGPIFLDTPENNPAAMELARRQGMREVFGCARMYLGPAPALAHHRIFGVTTFELG